MNPREVKTAADAAIIVSESRHSHVKIGVTDLDGILRGKYVARHKFLSGLESGLGFCDVVLGWDLDDQPYDNVQFTGWHTGFPDASIVVVPTTCRAIPIEGDMLLFLCDFSGEAKELCPRSILQRVIGRLEEHKMSALGSVEYEFFVFEETPASVREKNYRNLKPLSPGSFGYSVLRTSAGSEFFEALLDLCEQMEMPLEGLHTETGPGVLEGAITVSTALEAADRAALFKTYVKVLAQKHGLMATFMAKWSHQQAGQSGHVHLSLMRDTERAFFDASSSNRMSATMRHFIGGQVELMPELLAMVASNVNSYSRLVPGLWAPTRSNWGVENRTCAIRAIPGSPKSQRVEYRVAASDSNPYLAMAAALGSGIWGIENAIEPGDPVRGNAYESHQGAALPNTLWDAAQRLKSSDAARQLFGEKFVEHFAASREWEERMFRKHVTDWELSRYFEII